ncbi:hypothetical protein DFJ74DRAFT_613527 [Hyaloraphidium curvatum]|nr:hypothetical protein DFJ74DRAFT_613527 [Hyaloraphidium curvatum]
MAHHAQIPGLTVAKRVLSSDERAEILAGMASLGWFQREGQNQVMLFGALPAFFAPIEAASAPLLDPSLQGRMPLFNQSIVNRYRPGEGLKPHVDLARFEDGIAVASISGTATMEFERLGAGERVGVFMEPGDVICLNGPARWEWTHGIERRTEDVVDGVAVPRTERISVTLRRMPPDPDSDEG